MTWAGIALDALAAINTLCRAILPIDLDLHKDALRLAERYAFSTFDALVIAAALRAGCRCSMVGRHA